MTCVSERSGTASSGVRRSAAIPRPRAAIVPATVKTLWRAERATRRSITTFSSPPLRRRSQRALGADEEVSRGHHVVAVAEPAHHLVVTAGADSELDFARREAPVAQVHEHDVALAGRQDRALRH